MSSVGALRFEEVDSARSHQVSLFLRDDSKQLVFLRAARCQDVFHGWQSKGPAASLEEGEEGREASRDRNT